MVTLEQFSQLVAQYPPLTVLPVAGDPTRFYVLGRHEWWYEVKLAADSQEASCECKGWGFRRECAHFDAVVEHLRELHPCLFCDGYLVTRLEHHESRGYLIVATCALDRCSYRKVL